MPSAPISEADARLLRARPPASGAWRDGDPAGGRLFAPLGAFRTENGERLPFARLAYESWGELNAAGDNAVLVLHALTGDERLIGAAAEIGLRVLVGGRAGARRRADRRAPRHSPPQ